MGANLTYLGLLFWSRNSLFAVNQYVGLAAASPPLRFQCFARSPRTEGKFALIEDQDYDFLS
jgi:hypothetical protein